MFVFLFKRGSNLELDKTFIVFKKIEILKNYIMGQSMGQTNWTQFDPFWTTRPTSTYVDISKSECGQK